MKKYNSLIKGLLKKRFVFVFGEGAPQGDTAPETNKVSESGQARNLIRQKAINLLKDPNLKKEQRDALKKALDASTKIEVKLGGRAASISAATLLNQLRAHAKKTGKPIFNAYEQKALGGEKAIAEMDVKREKEAAKQLQAKNLEQAKEAKKGLPALVSDFEAKLGTVKELEKSLTSAYGSLDKLNKNYDVALGTFKNWKNGADKTDARVIKEMEYQQKVMESLKIAINTTKTAINVMVTAYKNAVTEHNQSFNAMRKKEAKVIKLERAAGVTDLTKQKTYDRITSPDQFPGQEAAKVALVDIPPLPDASDFQPRIEPHRSKA